MKKFIDDGYEDDDDGKSSSGEEEMADVIICDGCDGEYFLDETALKAVPDGDWLCEVCCPKLCEDEDADAR